MKTKAIILLLKVIFFAFGYGIFIDKTQYGGGTWRAVE